MRLDLADRGAAAEVRKIMCSYIFGEAQGAAQTEDMNAMDEGYVISYKKTPSRHSFACIPACLRARPPVAMPQQGGTTDNMHTEHCRRRLSGIMSAYTWEEPYDCI